MGTDLHCSKIGGFLKQKSSVISQFSDANFKIRVKNESIESEPTSVLDHECSTNSPNSRSSSINGGGVLPMKDLEDLLCFGVEGSFLPWFMGQVEDPNSSSKNFPQCGSSFGFDTSMNNNPSCVEPFGGFGGNSGGVFGFSSLGFDYNPKIGEHFGYSEHVVQPIQNPSYCTMTLDRNGVHNSRGQEQLLVPMVPQASLNESQISVFRDQLIMVSEMFQTGNFAVAQVILARLNHIASLPRNPPLVGAAAVYVRDELEKIILSMNVAPRSLGLDDVIHKINAYKLFSEVSPVMHFVDYTCTQALLEALEEDDMIHILDFDIGCGSMWASFIRELPLRKKGAPRLKITVLASTSCHHPFELALVCDTILEFAAEYRVSVDIKVLNLDLFDMTSSTFPGFQLLQNEAVAVKFPVWACSHCPFLLPPLLSFVKQCSPKIVMTFDRGCDRFDLPFPSHILHCLNSWSSLLESLNGASVPTEIIDRVDNSLIKPSIERTIQGRMHAPDKMQANKINDWKTLFQNAGFIPVTFSNSAEYQAEELVNKLPQKGFNVEKRQGSIVLRWRSHELIGGSVYNC